jgi:hypothetical protein
LAQFARNLVLELLLVRVSMGLERSRMIADRYRLVETVPIRNAATALKASAGGVGTGTPRDGRRDAAAFDGAGFGCADGWDGGGGRVRR